jgi:hypothetical protein
MQVSPVRVWASAPFSPPLAFFISATKDERHYNAVRDPCAMLMCVVRREMDVLPASVFLYEQFPSHPHCQEARLE